MFASRRLVLSAVPRVGAPGAMHAVKTSFSVAAPLASLRASSAVAPACGMASRGHGHPQQSLSVPVVVGGKRSFLTVSRPVLAVKTFKLADIGEGIAQVELLKWHKKVGDEVEEMEDLCQVQSDKAAVEITSRFTGKVLKLHQKEGAMVRIGAPLLDIDVVGSDEVAEGEDAKDDTPQSTSAPPATKTAPSSSASAPAPSSSASAPAPSSSASAPAPSSSAPASAAPATRRFAKEKGVDLSLVRGTGRNGLITKEDVIKFLEGSQSAAAPTPAAARAGELDTGAIPELSNAADVQQMPGEPEGERQQTRGRSGRKELARRDRAEFDADAAADPSGVRTAAAEASGRPAGLRLAGDFDDGAPARVNAFDDVFFPSAGQPQAPVTPQRPQRETTKVQLKGFSRAMVKAMNDTVKVPQLNIGDEYDVTDLVKMREFLVSQTAKKYNSRPTITAFLIKAVSLALDETPILNSKFDADTNDSYTQFGSHNISIAMDTPNGLVVPNIKNVQDLNILEIQAELHRLQGLAMDNKLSPADLQGGTISISNVGVISGTYVHALLFDGQACIVGVGQAQDLPRFVKSKSGKAALDDEDLVERRKIMTVAFTADHRHCDGATVARFNKRVKELLENPEMMLLHLR